MTRTGPAEQEWRVDAACADTAGDEWFPPPRSAVNPLLLRVCAGCPVWADCLLYAIGRPDIWHGIWAGLTARELAALRSLLLSGALGADLPEAARAITRSRGAVTIYYTAVPDPLPGYKQLRRERRRILARLRALGLLDGDGDGSRGQAA